jgi:hypothetical protein
MNFGWSRIQKISGAAVAVVTGLAGVSVAISPENLSNLHLDYMAFLLRRMLPELALLFLLALVMIWVPWSVWQRSWTWAVSQVCAYARAKKNWPDRLFVALLLTMFVLLSLNGLTLAGSRRYYIVDLTNRNYRSAQLERASHCYAAKEHGEALKILRALRKLFPENPNDYEIRGRIERIERTVAYSRALSQRGGRLANLGGCSRESAALLAAALELDPRNIDARPRLERCVRWLEEGRQVIGSVERECKTANTAGLAVLMNKWGWVFFESRGQGERWGRGQALCGLNGAALSEFVDDSWSLPYLRSLVTGPEQIGEGCVAL